MALMEAVSLLPAAQPPSSPTLINLHTTATNTAGSSPAGASSCSSSSSSTPSSPSSHYPCYPFSLIIKSPPQNVSPPSLPLNRGEICTIDWRQLARLQRRTGGGGGGRES